MVLHENKVTEIKDDTSFPLIKWMKYADNDWYVSLGNPKRWHCLYTDEETEARTNFFNGQYGPEVFLTQF
jgi:hypothetical protein